jgi:hypothetical protein
MGAAMKTIEIKGWIFAKPSMFDETALEYSFFPCDISSMSGYGEYVKICEHKIVSELPADFDPVTARISTLKAQRDQIRAELGKRIAQIEDQISKLTAIEYTPAQEAA